MYNFKIFLKLFEIKQTADSLGATLYLLQNHNTMSILQQIMSDAQSEASTPQPAENVDNTLINETPAAETPAPEATAEVTETPEAVQDNIQTQAADNAPVETPKKAYASDEVAQLDAFLRNNPDKSLADFQRLKTPTAELDPKELLKQYFSDKEGMTEKEIAYELSQLEVNGEGDDFDDDFSELSESEKLKREAQLEKRLREAREWRDAEVAKQLSVTESAEQQTPQADVIPLAELQKRVEQQQRESHEQYLKTVYAELPNIQSFTMDIGGEKVEYVPDEATKTQIKAALEDPAKLYSKFYAEDGSLRDVKGFAEMLMRADETTFEKVVQFRVNQAIERYKRDNDKQRRNVSAEVNTASTPNVVDGADAFEQWRKSQQHRII